MQVTLLLNALGVGIAAFLFSLFLTPLVRRFAISIGCVARPSKDRWGRRIVARLGGLPLAFGFLTTVGWAARHDPRLIGLVLGGALILLVGLLDDLRALHPYSKLVAQIISGCLVVLSGIQADISVSWLTIPLTIVWLVFVMNAFNLMDNMDGLSGGIGAIAAAFCTWHALQSGQALVAMASASLCGATLGFLRYNLPPAKIFMGDTGSQVLGLGLGTLALLGTWHQSARLIGIVALPVFLLAVPIFDTCFVTVQRLLHGRHPFQGGTDHLSHRLGILGLTTRQIVFIFYTVGAVFGLLGIFLSQQNPMAVTGISLLVVGLLLVIGAYLAKVRVYTGSAIPAGQEPRIAFLETMLMHKRRLLEVCVDFALICASYVIAHALRFEGTLTPELEKLILNSLPWIIVVKLACFFSCGLYRGVWRYISLPDLINIFRAVTLGSILSALVVLYLWRFEGYSRAVFIIDGLLLFITVGGARIVEPLLNEWLTASIQDARPVLIIGAGDTGELLLQQLKLTSPRKHRVIGFLDDDAAKHGNSIHGIPIMGSRQDLGKVVKEWNVQEVLIAMRTPPDDLVQQVRSYCEENSLNWKVVDALAQGRSTVGDALG